MATPSSKEGPSTINFLRKFVPHVLFLMPSCLSIVDTILREKLGISSPKEIYIPGPEHDNCTLQTDKYYTHGKQESKEKDGRKQEKDGEGAHTQYAGGECASYSHAPSKQGNSHSRNSNPTCPPLRRSDEHGWLKNPHAYCCKSGSSSHDSKHSRSIMSLEVIHASQVHERGCLNKNCVLTSSNHDFSTGTSPEHLNVDYCSPHEEIHLYDCQGKGSSSNPFTKSTERHDCCALGPQSHDLHDENSWKSSDGDYPTLYSSLNRDPSRSSLRDYDSAPSSRDSSKKTRQGGCHTEPISHESSEERSTHSYQTNGHINDQTHDHTHDHKCSKAHSHIQTSPNTAKTPSSKARHLFGALVPPSPTHSSTSTPVPENLIYKLEPVKKDFISLVGIGPTRWNRSGKSIRNQGSTKQSSSGKVSAPRTQ